MLCNAHNACAVCGIVLVQNVLYCWVHEQFTKTLDSTARTFQKISATISDRRGVETSLDPFTNLTVQIARPKDPLFADNSVRFQERHYVVP